MYVKIECKIKSRYGSKIVEGAVINAQNRLAGDMDDWHISFIDTRTGQEIYFNQSEDIDMKLIEIKE